MEDEDHDAFYKFILLGDAGVGKTNIFSRFICDEFALETPSTITMEFGRKVLEINDKKVKLQIWDTAGQEKYRAVTKNYIKGSRGVLLIYDISKAETFKNIDSWYNLIQENGDKDTVVELIGNKYDLEEAREVSEEEGKNKALELNSLFNETSALRGDNIEEAFTQLVEAILNGQEKKDSAGQTEETPKEKGEGNINLAESKEEVVNDEGQKKKKKKKKCCI